MVGWCKLGTGKYINLETYCTQNRESWAPVKHNEYTFMCVQWTMCRDICHLCSYELVTLCDIHQLRHRCIEQRLMSPI